MATTLLCVHRENIHPASGGISFRTKTKTKRTRSGPDAVENYSGFEGVGSEGLVTPSFQQLGTVMLQEGRSITFPNVLQHKFEVPKLVDHSSPGHIQLLQIHLVDPHYIVCSTRHVPPQSTEWWSKTCFDGLQRKHKLSSEVTELIIDQFIGHNTVFLSKE